MHIQHLPRPLSLTAWAETEQFDPHTMADTSAEPDADIDSQCEPASSAPRLRPLQFPPVRGSGIGAALVAAIATMAAIAHIVAGWAQ